MAGEEDLPTKAEESKDTLEDDYFACEVKKPQRGEGPYGDEDKDFMSLLTDPAGETNLFEIVNKIAKEKERKEMLMKIDSPHQYNRRYDLFLNEKEMQEKIRMHKSALEYMNYEHQIVENHQQRIPAFKRNPSSIEQAFIQWYSSIFGDEWRLITDVINYHPFSRGYLREPDEIRYYFFVMNDQRGHIYSPKLNIEPSRFLNLPVLLNQRPPSLLYSVSKFGDGVAKPKK